MRTLLALLFGLAGMIGVYLAVRVLNGTYKRWILSPQWHHPKAGIWRPLRCDCPTWGISTALIMLVSGILGIETCVVVGLAPYLGSDGVLWGVGVIFVTLLFALAAPVGRKWFTSHWAYWLEENYLGELDMLIDDIRRDPIAWERRVSTQEGLEEWAVEVTGKLSKEQRARQEHRQKEAVRAAIESFGPGGPFTVADLEHACPGVGREMIWHVLNQLRYRGRVECEGRGWAARWRRV